MHELEIVLKDCLISMRACQTALNCEGKAILEQPASEAVRSVLSLWDQPCWILSHGFEGST